MPGLDQLIGTSFGPFPVDATRERADAFLEAIGGDALHDPAFVHPMFANAVLFAAAPAFLDDERVRPHTVSLIHSEQTYEWHRSLPVDSLVEVTGTVESVRARGPLSFVTFGLEATTSAGPWLTGTSLFLLSPEAAAAADDGGEPAEDLRPPFDEPLERLELPEVGERLPSMLCGASRIDLARYAEASGDRNPIHLDHDAARRAGLEGVIVHGLLMAAWMARAAGRYGSPHAMKVRFRNPLRPSMPAHVTGSVAASAADSADLELVLGTGDHRLVTGTVSVTR